MSGEGDGGSPNVNITVKFTSSDKAAGSISISLQSTVGSFKKAIRTQLDAQPKRLIFQGRILSKDDQTLAECKLQDGHTVVVQAAPAGSSVPPSACAARQATASSNMPGVSVNTPATGVAGPTAQAASASHTGAQGEVKAPVAGASSPVGMAVSMIRGQSTGVAQECLSTLTKVIDNILAHPMEEKYRKIKRANAGFRRKVGGVPGGEACMRALGFKEVNANQEDQGSWLLAPTADAWNVLNAARAEIQAALAQVAAASNASPRVPSSTIGGGTAPGFPAGLGVLPSPGAYNARGPGRAGFGSGAVPDMATIMRMAQNPAVMQGMMNDPSVQAMMRNNPQMARAMQTVTSNPGLMSQMTNMMQNNPAMMEHAQRMMQNPAALERAAQVDLDGAFAAGAAGSMNPGLGAGFPTATGGATPTFPTPNPPAAPPAPVPTPSATSNSVVPPANSQNSTGEGTEEASGEMSEDDILAEAIRRSMEDS